MVYKICSVHSVDPCSWMKSEIHQEIVDQDRMCYSISKVPFSIYEPEEMEYEMVLLEACIHGG